ncbi:hypothetical protein KAFR_0B04640 [Kazachstania africana CBS 2517]|uniref:Alpha-mannosidase n=1 Tax=Kazachstania africana (strain ATCC 22294 / BCRC 22015 / CBS 2517 / CECT 1963 / NBRC 1671 / NRRL Y-8276) TaxID=1071382 RepID=H2AQW1_KAZAF|nr:hypothetical protein KAFR_0B04640 [Kazachstania africana CBS 2517]CCF56761.1 hypothetical protein KAFR_0B04640 [Kazachstania africana CBS 2517]
MSYERVNYDPQFKPVQNIFEDRLRQFIRKGGDYCDLNLPKFYDKQRISLDQNSVKALWYQVPFEKGSSPVSPDKRPSWKSILDADRKNNLTWQECYKGQPFGPSWSTTWFKIYLKVPQKWIDSGEQLLFDWNCNNEGVVIDPETLLPVTAFSGGERTEYLLPKNNTGEYLFYIEAGNNGMFGCGAGSTINPPDENRYFHLDTVDIVWPDWEARALYFDFWMLSDAARELPGDTWQKHRARHVANKVMDLFDINNRSSVAECRELIKSEYFDEYADTAEVFYKGDSQQLASVYGIGNCHIDTAWLWPFAETKRKIVRSWASQCVLMDEYPEYQFVASQAQQFKWLLQNHPDFFNNVIIPKVQQSQFIPIGGSWVENDTNIPSGESLARQFFFGQRFFLKHFGFKSDIFWLPDTFGYSSQIPQLCQLSGITKFLTQKLSWNNINSFPHSTFNWAGLDGSQLLTHMPPGNTYTADSHFGDVLRTAKQNKSSEFYGSGLMLYGKGDGGGGPTREMLEKMRRIRSMSNRNGNVIPKLHVGATVDDFYQDILDKTDSGKNLPTWMGELYFEFHRGTYTSQANTKKLMRMAEIRIHDLEWIATKTSILFPDSFSYPVNQINELWENILLCQFHDVLPGSCIEMVYKYEAVPMLRNVVKKTEEMINDIISYLERSRENSKLVGVSTLSWKRNLAKSLNSQDSVSIDVTDDSFILSNGVLTVTINKVSGTITSLKTTDVDAEFIDLKNGRNKVGANQFVLFDDKPLSWQAWDTELYSVDQYKYLTDIERVHVTCNTPEKCTVEVTVKLSDTCKITSSISLAAHDKNNEEGNFVDITCSVSNWDRRNEFLKVEFPVNIRNDFASYETQFGVTKRPTHYNTSWDVAKFEVCGHKFTDYSEYTKGVSILNDSKYGFSTHGNLMRLSLLRSPKAPDAHADMGDHKMRYAIYPHKNGLSSKTVRLAYEYNYTGNYGIPDSLISRFESIIGIKGDENVVLSNIKRGEDDSELKSEYSLKPEDSKSMIVRVFESLGGESRAILSTSLHLKNVTKIDNLEMEQYEEVEFTKDKNGEDLFAIAIALRPFEVASYRLEYM